MRTRTGRMTSQRGPGPFGYERAKIARTAPVLVARKLQTGLDPRQAPVQRTKRQPRTGRARRATGSPLATARTQVRLHGIVPLMAPRPVTATLSSSASRNTAEMVVGAVRVSVQSGASPVQPAVQPRKR